jgi:hypothetical protein
MTIRGQSDASSAANLSKVSGQVVDSFLYYEWSPRCNTRYAHIHEAALSGIENERDLGQPGDIQASVFVRRSLIDFARC